MGEHSKTSRAISELFSYISAFNLGMYTLATINGQPVADYRWVLTIAFGVFFYLLSKK